MANFSGMILTKKGRNLLAKALTGTPLTFTKIKLGSGQYNTNTDIENLNDLLHPELTLPIQSIEITGDGTAKIRFVLRNDSLQNGFFLSEIGVFANDPDLGEILYSVAYTSQPDFIPSAQTTRIEIVVDVYVVVSNAESVTATISDTLVLATREDIEKLKNNIISGQVIAGNALKLSGYEASVNPQEFRIPVTDQNGKLSFEWMYDISEEMHYQSDYYVSTNFPQDAKEGSICYRFDTNKLYRYTGNGYWQEIDWQKVIRRMPEFQINRLRINNGMLEISPDGIGWYPCYPLIGANVFNIRTLDNQNYTYKYYLPPGATVTIENANHVPIVYVPGSIFSFVVYFSFSYEGFVGIRPSNIAISDGDGQWASGVNSSSIAGRYTDLSIVPMSEMGNSPENWFQSTLIIHSNQRMFTLSQSKSYSSYGVAVHTGSGTASSTSYWLGTWYRQDGVQFTAEYVTITRRR